MPRFLVIPADIAKKCEGYQVGENVFTTLTTLDGRHVCAAGSLEVFFDLFQDRRIVPVELGPQDFPSPPRLLN